MVNITIPNNNIEERKYVINTFFRDFIGIQVNLSIADILNWEIQCLDKKIIVEDAFFSKFQQELSYLQKDCIPTMYSEDYVLGAKLVRIFGSGKYENTSKSVFLGNDIFAATFFLLTQWEEIILKKEEHKTIYDKLKETELFLVRNNLYARCIVNEYITFIRKLLNIEQSTHKFKVMLTHDVDRCYLSDERELCVNVLNMLKAGQVTKATKILSDYLSYPKDSNPFDSFSILMDMAEKAKCKAYFYFKACKRGDEGYTYSLTDETPQKAIREIINRNHYIGLHASENTVGAYNKLLDEYKELKEISGSVIEGGRTHQLIYDGEVFSNLSNIGLQYDSSVGFQYYNGFRTSVCLPYYIFDVIKRRTLNIKQIPFSIMDSVTLRQTITPDEFYKQIENIINIVKSYEGYFVSNWHSNMFLARGREDYVRVYRQMMEYILNKQNEEE